MVPLARRTRMSDAAVRVRGRSLPGQVRGSRRIRLVAAQWRPSSSMTTAGCGSPMIAMGSIRPARRWCKGFVTHDQLVQRRAQRRAVRAAKAQRLAHVVGCAAGPFRGAARCAAAEGHHRRLRSRDHRDGRDCRAPSRAWPPRWPYEARGPSMVGCSNRLRKGRSTLKRRTLETICAASSEWPPRSKKFVRIPKPDSRGRPARCPASSSRGTAAIRWTRRFELQAAGLRRSTLPLARRGNCGRNTRRAGTMCSGSFARCARRPWASVPVMLEVT